VKLEGPQAWDIRENILRILRALILRNNDVLTAYNQILEMHKLKLAKGVQECEKEKQELYIKELKLVECCQKKENEQQEESKTEESKESKSPLSIKMM